MEKIKLFILGLLFSIFTLSTAKPMTTFKAPNNKNVSQIAVNYETGTVYIGADNALYQLSADLILKLTTKTGPVLDHPQCGPGPVPANCNETRTLRDNQNVVLEIDTDQQLLLSCGTTDQGRCAVHYDLSDIRNFENLNNSITSFVGGRQEVVAFFGEPPFASVYHGRQKALYTAMTYDSRKLDYFPKAISTRLLQQTNPTTNEYKMRYLMEGYNQYSAIEILKQYRSNFIVHYVYGFEHRQFTYFIAVMRDSLQSNNYHTRLIRICQHDHLYVSYMELPLKCALSGVEYNIATSATVVPLSAEVVYKLNKTMTTDSALFITFSESHKRTYDVDTTKDSVVCYHTMWSIEKAFQGALYDCYRMEMGHYVEWFHQPKTTCYHNGDEAFKILRNIDYCGSMDNYPIEASTKLDLKFWYGYSGVYYTSLAYSFDAKKQVDDLVLGTNSGQIHKVRIDPNMEVYPYAKFQLIEGSTSPIQKDWAHDKGKKNIYFLSGNQVTKFSMNSCGFYRDCGSCIQNQESDPCGWCYGVCTVKAECKHSGWTNDSCPPVIHDFMPKAGPTKGGTQIEISGANFGSSSSSAMVIVSVAKLKCQILHSNQTSITCKTGNASKDISGQVAVSVVEEVSQTMPYKIDGKDDTQDRKFFYKTPRVEAYFPHVGPQSGGTLMTINGSNLDIGSEITILVGSSVCLIQEINSFSVQCLTSSYTYSAKPQNRRKRIVYASKVSVNIDGNAISQEDQLYTYEEDPSVSALNPQRSFVSGGLEISVKGERLHIIQNPKLNLTIAETEFIQECVPRSNGYSMTCKSPNITSLLYTNSSSVNDSTGIEARVSFIMDDVQSVREFYKHQNHQTFHFYQDPVFFPFNDVIELFKDDKYLTIRGENLNLALEDTFKTAVQVLIGQDACDVITLTADLLICLPIQRPSDISSDEPKRPVKVEVGNLKFDIGNVRYAEKSNTILLVACIVTVVVILILAVGFLLLFMKKKHLGPWKPPKRNEPPGIMYIDGEIVDIYDEEGNLIRRESRSNAYGRLRASQRSGRSVHSATSMVDEEAVRLLQDTNQLIKREDLLLGEIVGKGHFGCVFKGYLTIEGEKADHIVAVKSLQSAQVTDTDITKFLKEALMMKDFKHANILDLVGISISDDSLPLIILPFMEKGDLLSYLRDENNMPTVKDLMEFGKQVASGMTYLVEIKFVHRDLAARNCMLGDDNTVKVADFGLSRDIYERDYYSSSDKHAKLPIKWMSPESMEKGIYNHKSDVWSFGVVLWELMTRGVTPYPGVDNWDVLKYIKQGRRMPQPSFCPIPMYQLMRQCWTEDANKRPTFKGTMKLIDDIINLMEDEENLYDRPVDTNVSYVNLPTDDEISADELAETENKRASKGKRYVKSPHNVKKSKSPQADKSKQKTLLPPKKTVADLVSGNMTGTSIQFADDSEHSVKTASENESSTDEAEETDNLLTENSPTENTEIRPAENTDNEENESREGATGTDLDTLPPIGIKGTHSGTPVLQTDL